MSRDEWRAWFAEHWVGWLRPVSVMAVMAALAAVHFLGWMDESPFARLLAVMFAFALAVAPAVQGARLATAPWARWTTSAIGLVAAVAIVWPVWKMTAPGAPVAEKALAQGQSLDLEAAPSGGLTVLVEDSDLLVQHGFDRRVVYKLVASDGQHQEELTGELSRSHTQGRGRKGVTMSSESVHPAEVHTLSWTKGSALHLTLAGGGASLVVRVFDSAVPWLLLLALTGAALVAGVLVDARGLPHGERTFVPHSAAVALLFLLMTKDALEPLTPVRPLFGSIMITGIVGLLAGILLSWAGRRVLTPAKVRGAKPARKGPQRG